MDIPAITRQAITRTPTLTAGRNLVKRERGLENCSNMRDRGGTFAIFWILYLPSLCLHQFDQNVLICCPFVGSIWSCLHVLHLINHNRVDDAVAEQPTAGGGVETLQQQYQRTNNQYQVESPPPSPRLMLVRNQSKPSNTNATTNTRLNVVFHPRVNFCSLTVKFFVVSA